MMMGSLELADMDDYQFPLPGFRFHPTDEELVGFYLRRKVENKAVGIELIKQIDIYKYSPWDLPHTSGGTGEKEWYFFTKRGRKYKNSVRPNRVTGSGFWKATGIDKQIYSQSQSNHHQQCVGLKKTLVYYRGSAGRGTKTEWMMNEFRLPSISNTDEAEIWTLCRIFKRNVSSRKFTPNWRENPATSAKGSRTVENMSFKTRNYNNNLDQNAYDNEESRYINFSSSFISFDDEKKGKGKQWNQLMRNFSGSSTDQTVVEAEADSPVNVSPVNSSSFSDFDEDANDLFGYEKWEELKSIMESDLDSYESLLKLS